MTALFRYRFGTAEFDEARFELRVGGLLVEVQRKPLQILARLLATPGETVDKETLFAEVWKQRATGDAVLANAISKLRAALGENNQPFLVTVPRRGFRLDGAVERTAVGRRQVSHIALTAGEPAPGRPGFRLAQLLASTASHETWLIEAAAGGERRVQKFALDGERLAGLKREVTLNRVLFESPRADEAFVRITAWSFEAAPWWIESAFAGPSLDRWAEESIPGGARLAQLGFDARLGLVLQIASAVAAAHDAGVLHKDLKPANVLIEERDGTLHARLADFGSGQVTDAERLEALRITRLGLTVGEGTSADGATPLYLAPELLTGQAPGVRSDVFALGVMAFQIMAGDLRRVMAPGWERDLADPLLRADLAAATDVDPQRRLASAADFIARLRDLPARRAAAAAAQEAARQDATVQAALARTRARRPWLIAALAAMALGLTAAWWLFAREQHARQQLAAELRTSSALNRLLREDLLGAANPALHGRADITVADALAGAAAQVEEKFAAQAPAVRASLHATLHSALSELSRSAEAVTAGQRALAAWSEVAAPDVAAMQETRLRLAIDLVQLSRLEEAAEVVRQIEAAVAGRPMAPDVEARLLFAKSWVTAGDFALQESTAQLERAQQLVGALDETQAPWRDKILFGLADNYTMLGRHAEAEKLFRQVMEDQQRRLGANHIRPAYTAVGLARAVMNQGRLDEAAELLRQAHADLGKGLGPAHRQTLTALDQLADVRMRQRRHAEAAELWRVAHQGFAALLGEGSSYTLTLATNRALALRALGGLREAEALLRDSLVRVRAIVPEDSPQPQQIRYALAECLVAQRRPREAVPLMQGLTSEALNLAQQESDWPERLARLRQSAGVR